MYLKRLTNSSQINFTGRVGGGPGGAFFYLILWVPLAEEMGWPGMRISRDLRFSSHSPTQAVQETILVYHTVCFIKPYRSPVINTPNFGKVLLNGYMQFYCSIIVLLKDIHHYYFLNKLKMLIFSEFKKTKSSLRFNSG